MLISVGIDPTGNVYLFVYHGLTLRILVIMCVSVVPTIGAKISEVSLVSPLMTMKTRKLLKGHQSRIVSFDWSPDKRHLVSGGQVHQ